MQAPYVAHELLVKQLALDGHLQLIERVLQHVVGIQVINPASIHQDRKNGLER